MKDFIKDDKQNCDEKPIRLEMGEAWMMCNECGAKLYSFDGYQDGSRSRPYKRYGKCEP